MNVTEFDPSAEDEKQPFEITDLSTLGWAFRKIAERKAEQRKIEEYAQSELDRIKEWRDKEFNKHEDSIEFFQSKIQSYHFNQMMENPDLKTLSTPYGKSKTTTYKPSPEKVDEQSLLDYIHSNDLKGYVKESVEWGKLKKTLQVFEKEDGEFITVDEDGYIVPGVVVKPEETKFSLEVAE